MRMNQIALQVNPSTSLRNDTFTKTLLKRTNMRLHDIK